MSGATLSYTFSGVASGDIGGTPFTDAVFTITGTADTASPSDHGDPGVVSLPTLDAILSVQGFGTVSLTDSLEIVSVADETLAGENRPFTLVGITRWDGENSDAILLAFFVPGVKPSLDTWDGISPLYPAVLISDGPGLFMAGNFTISPGGTSRGDLSLTSVSDTYFSAGDAPAPEPASLLLAGFGLAACAAVRFRRRTD